MPAATAADLPTLLEIDRLNYLPDYILRKADLCTMAHGLEMRAPFLDHRFVGAVMGLPDAERFTTPPRRLLAPAEQQCRTALRALLRRESSRRWMMPSTR